jgi:SAM-dependent methyltransferase
VFGGAQTPSPVAGGGVHYFEFTASGQGADVTSNLYDQLENFDERTQATRKAAIFSVDVVISNCVINLSTDKAAVLAEIARVLRPGGRMGVSDVVSDDDMTPAERAVRGSFAGCIAGALSFAEYRAGLEAVGLTDLAVTPTHAVGDGLHGAIVRATKPAGWTAAAIRPISLPAPVRGLPVSAGGSCCGGNGCC